MPLADHGHGKEWIYSRITEQTQLIAVAWDQGITVDTNDNNGKEPGEKGLKEVEYGLHLSGSGQGPISCSCDHSSEIQAP
jgi:hypothetical protein